MLGPDLGHQTWWQTWFYISDGLLARHPINDVRRHGRAVRSAGADAAGDPGHQDARHPG